MESDKENEMPCYDARDSYDKDLDHIGAGLLCELIKAGAVYPNANPVLAQWWMDHQNRDAYHARRYDEAAKKRG